MIAFSSGAVAGGALLGFREGAATIIAYSSALVRKAAGRPAYIGRPHTLEQITDENPFLIAISHFS